MNDLSYLQRLTGDDFEAERRKLIMEEIMKAPPERRLKLIALQMELDKLRDKVTPEQFIAECLKRAGENLENLADQFTVIAHLAGHQPTRPA